MNKYDHVFWRGRLAALLVGIGIGIVAASALFGLLEERLR
jgi:hypothetical protein